MAEQEDNQITLTIHGLTLTDGRVLAHVFVSEFKRLLDALERSDKQLNKSKSHEYVIVSLSVGSAMATLRETLWLGRRANRDRRTHLARLQARVSPVSYFQRAITSIYNGTPEIRSLPPRLIKDVEGLAKDSGETFAHGEVLFGPNNIIRIDDYLSRQARRAIERLSSEEESSKYFAGISYGTFDGVLKEVDARGLLVRGKLILTAGAKEIDCVFRQDDIDPIVRTSFNLRARVEGMAHYSGDSPLPERIDIKRITPVKDHTDLLRWKGAFEPKPAEHDTEDDL